MQLHCWSQRRSVNRSGRGIDTIYITPGNLQGGPGQTMNAAGVPMALTSAQHCGDDERRSTYDYFKESAPANL